MVRVLESLGGEEPFHSSNVIMILFEDDDDDSISSCCGTTYDEEVGTRKPSSWHDSNNMHSHSTLF